VVSTASSSAAQKLGHPVPLSNLADDENSASAHPAQLNVPSRSSWSNALL
jgi:hypothetical protein